MSSVTQTARSDSQIIDDTYNRLRLEYRNHGHRTNASATIPIGLFGNLVGAEVAAEQRINVGKNGEYVCVRHTLVVACTGFGCTEPLNEIKVRDLIFDCDHGEITEEARLAARKQAQAHAETCRALPRPTV